MNICLGAAPMKNNDQMEIFVVRAEQVRDMTGFEDDTDEEGWKVGL
jgi:hypothetical protein